MASDGRIRQHRAFDLIGKTRGKSADEAISELTQEIGALLKDTDGPKAAMHCIGLLASEVAQRAIEAVLP